MRVTLGTILLCTLAIGLWFTSEGMFGGIPDSIAYEGAASNISEGRGITTPFALLTERASPRQQAAWGDSLPLSEQPPGYPLALAAADAMGFSGDAGARVVSIVGLTLLAAVVAGAAKIGLGRRALPVAAITTLVVLGPGSFAHELSSSPLSLTPLVLSERIALPLSLLALTMIAFRLPEVRSLKPQTVDRICLSITALVIFASTLTRFTGVACGVACAAAIAMDNRRTRRSRIIWASAILTIGPATITGISLLVGGSPKTIAWHPLPIIEPLVDVMGQWFLMPNTLPLALRIVALSVLVIAPIVLAFAYRGRNPDRRALAIALATFNVVYASIVVFTVLLLDAVVGINARFLSPIQASAYLLLAIEAMEITSSHWPRMQSATIAVLSFAALALALPAITQLTDSRSEWALLRRLETTANERSSLHNIPKSTFIFSDDPPKAWNIARLTAYKLPLEVVATTAQPNPDFEEHLNQVVAITNANDSLVVVSVEMQPPTDIDAYLSRGLKVLAKCPDLTVIGRSDSSHTAAVTRAPCAIPETT